ncbi:circadian clock protein KaiC [Ectothiorhodospira shaposhnikovii]|uniref:circadian clock protein KaiC n=1 Tax=Ectothiorhodospira shaposhnikovii TaxID=1054 RepID=UPI001EE8B91D|nr:circadian clock protein KaiC [Ectothiorhodospira shaposhnikovii]
MTTANPETAATGIQGLDFLLQGGLPRGRPTLLRGGPGTGKTVISLTFLCHGIRQGENGVLVTFDESPEALIRHAAGFGFAADRFIEEGRLRILDMRPDRNEVVGDYVELTAVMARIDHALQKTGAQRLVVDAMDVLEGAFSAEISLRGELARVFDWLRECRTSSLITIGEQEEFTTRYGLEDYVADCVIALKQDLDHRVMTRLLRVVKRRGGGHGTSEAPFLLDGDGIFMIPVTGSVLRARVSDEHFSTGIPGLDAMLGGQGPYRGSTLLFSGQAGTGKTSMAAAMTVNACEQGRKVLYISFEESVDELVRNQLSIGADLRRHTEGSEADRRLILQPVRAVELGLEEHLMRIMRSIRRHQPDLVVLDPISSLATRRTGDSAKDMLLRLIHLIKEAGITAVATELLTDDSQGVSHLDVSSMIDVWIKLRRHENNGEMNRLITVVKARGLPISSQVKEFRFTDQGLVIEDPYIGESGIAYGTVREARQSEDEQVIEQLHTELSRAMQRRHELDEINAAAERLARAERDTRALDIEREIAGIERRLANIQRARSAISRSRQ